MDRGFQSLPTTQLEELRMLFRNGNYDELIPLAIGLIESHPSSAATNILLGDAFFETGKIQEAHSCYEKALDIYKGRFPEEADSRAKKDLKAARERLIATAIVLGEYQKAREVVESSERLNLSSTKEPQDFWLGVWEGILITEIRENGRERVVNTFRNQRYPQTVKEATRYLAFTGNKDLEIELVLVNSLIMKKIDASLKDLFSAFHIASRLLRQHNDDPNVLTTYGLVLESISRHPKRDFLIKAIPELAQALTHPLKIALFYRKALELDPDNKIAHERFKEITGKDFQEKWSIFDYSPPSDLPVSPRLKRNPTDILSEKVECSWYWAQHKTEYQRFIEQLDRQIGQPMELACRIAVCIPAFAEGKNIYRTLAQYTKQEGIKPDQFEIIVFENHPADPKFVRDNTAAEIKRFKQDYPNMRVHHVYYAYPPEAAVMGNIRKTVFDLALWRNMKRNYGERDLILASNDADSYGMKPSALSFLINKFDKEPWLDLIAGKWDYPKESHERFPTVHALMRFVRYYRHLQEQYFGKSRVISSGACSYFRTSVYAAIGGYAYRIKRGSDTELGLRIAHRRKFYLHRRLQSTNELLIYTDPRRALSKMVIGKKWVDQWNDTDWQRDPRVAGKNWQDYDDRSLIVLNRARLEEEINAFLRSKLSAIVNKPNSKTAKNELWLIDQTMKFLSIPYSIKDGKIVLGEDLSQLKANLDRFLDEPDLFEQSLVDI